MRPFLVKPFSRLKGKVTLPGDKSIAHRAAILAALIFGKTSIRNFPANQDCQFTLKALQKLGVSIKRKQRLISVVGKGLYGLKKPQGPVFVGESGTTIRLFCGLLAGQNFKTMLSGARLLSKRPMRRVADPLRKMGAIINLKNKEYPPISIKGGSLKAITYKMPVASAQVKSAILLAGLYAKGKTTVIEPVKTRDHTERILKLFRAPIKVKGSRITISGGRELVSAGAIYVPGDISSAAFFMVAAAILPGSEILIKNTSLNPSRIGIIQVLKRMGANLLTAYSLKCLAAQFEPMGDILIKGSKLRGTVVEKEEIPSLIDELPVLMVAACFAQGKTVFEGVGELRVKETDRIRSMTENLSKMGAYIEVTSSKTGENIVVYGVDRLSGASVRSFGDHRTAMSLMIAGLAAQGATRIDDVDCIKKSFPEFLKILHSLIVSG